MPTNGEKANGERTRTKCPPKAPKIIICQMVKRRKPTKRSRGKKSNERADQTHPEGIH